MVNYTKIENNICTLPLGIVNEKLLIIKYTNEESDVFHNIKGEFKSVNNDFSIIIAGNTIDDKIPFSTITRISIPTKIPAKLSFISGFCFGAGITLISIGIMAYQDPLNLIAVPLVVPMAVLGGLTSYIFPKFRKTKVYLIQKNEWKIVND